MPTVNIEQDIRTMLVAYAGLTSAIKPESISHGYRLQDGVLPALTYEISSLSQESIGGVATVRLATVQLNIVAETTKAALDIVPALRGACAAGTYGTTVFDAVIWKQHVTSPASVGEGDEQEPAEVTASIDIYYRD